MSFKRSAALLLVACGSHATSFSSDGGPASDGVAPDGGSPTFDDAPSNVDGATDGCAAEAKLIYVISDDDETLYSFYPPTLMFTKIGAVACENDYLPFAMSVARDGFAWVLYEDGNIFRVSTVDASCTPTAYVPNQGGFSQFGMGFAADAPNSTSETLYVCWTQGLAKIDPLTLNLTTIGAMPGLDISSGCDLTGTGAAQLFSFDSGQAGWTIAQIDMKTSAPIWQKSLTPPLTASGSWGTSFWGGDLYLYKADLGTGSAVWRYRPSDQTMVQLVADVGFTIVGAGESTCAPTTPPN
ncbi:MAG TPA: hypothetical protein VH054_02840 [Polyangiaceae bacterium]|jgi:hypothetical protein|nr:hypothetical protein [Polyangiaceae bacterium]